MSQPPYGPPSSPPPGADGFGPPVPHGAPDPYGQPGPYGQPNPYAQPVPYAQPPAPVVLDPLPTEPVDYHQMLRTPRQRWWKGLLMIVSFVVTYLVLSLLLQVGAIGIDVATGRIASSDLLAGKLTLTPAVLLSVNLTNALCIPVSMLLQRAFFGQRGRWLHSVVGAFRWRLLGRLALVVLPIWAVYLAVTLIFSGERLVAPRGEAIALLAIVLLTTPFQSAGEEYGARGLIARGAGSWLADRRASLVVATLVSSVVFMLAHGAGDPWLISFYFVFGVLVSLATWRTGGLEAAVLLHATNNLIAFGSGILLGQDLSAALDRSDGAGSPAVLLPAGAMLLSVLVVWWWSRRHGVVRTYAPTPALTAHPEHGVTGSPAPDDGLPPRQPPAGTTH